MVVLALLAPSMMCADPLNLGKEVKQLEDGKADMLHCDIFDGHYTNNLGLGLYLIKALASHTDLPLDIHLGVKNPENYLERLADYGADSVSIHAGSTPHLIRAIKTARDLGMKAAVAYNAPEPLAGLEYVVELVDMIVIMTVSLGFSGQEFIPQALRKIEQAKNIAERYNVNPLIQVDGNINKDTIPMCVKAGANVLVLGTSSLFREGLDRARALEEIRGLAQSVIKQ